MTDNRVLDLILQPSPAVKKWPADQLSSREADNALRLNIQEVDEFPNLHSDVLDLDVERASLAALGLRVAELRERGLGADLLRGSGVPDGAFRQTTFVFLLVHLAVAIDFDLAPFREEVDNADADTV